MDPTTELQLIRVLKEIAKHLESIDEKLNNLENLDNLEKLKDLENIYHGVIDLSHYLENK
jgi:hypothetical protein